MLPGMLSPEACKHSLRCRSLPPLTAEEVARMIDHFLTGGGAVTRVPAAYVAPTLAAAPPAAKAEPRDAPLGG